MKTELRRALRALRLPAPDSHKGQNGRLLVIGGSRLFHASLFWAAAAASRFVDIVHLTSLLNENRQAVRQKLKSEFWQGIVVEWQQLNDYLAEDDCVLIGPGMERSAETKALVERLLTCFPTKKWVIDGGALQVVNPTLLSPTMIITPHQREWAQLWHNYQRETTTSFAEVRERLPTRELDHQQNEWLIHQLKEQGVTTLLTGQEDQLFHPTGCLRIKGGHAGLTKGGTGDVLAGLVAAFYSLHSAQVATVVASWLNKHTSERLAEAVGPYFNPEDLIKEIPATLWTAWQEAQSGD